jgi:IclR family transcriptional regulator, acetate operon repressor
VEQEFQRGTQTIDRAAQLLTLVIEADEPRALSDLAGDAELPKSTASRLLGALERQGLIQQRGRRGSFEPGPVLLRYANRGQLVELAQPHLEALSAISGETINLAVPGPLGVEHLAQIESRHFLGTGDWVGRRVPYDCTAVGKVLVAFGGADRGPLDPAELARVRRDGYATAVDELEVGLTAVAAPIRNAHADVVASISVSGPTFRLDDGRVEEVASLVVTAADEVSHRLGWGAR